MPAAVFRRDPFRRVRRCAMRSLRMRGQHVVQAEMKLPQLPAVIAGADGRDTGSCCGPDGGRHRAAD